MQQQEAFDPYRKWLGIAPKDQPPNYYRLLGIDLFENDMDVIANAADQRMTHIRTFQSGPHGAHSQRILNELSAARVCLLDPQKRAEYDAGIEEKVSPEIANAEKASSQPMAVARSAPPRPADKRWRNEADEFMPNGDTASAPQPSPSRVASRLRGVAPSPAVASGKSVVASRRRSGPSMLPILLGVGAAGAVAIGAIIFMLSGSSTDARSVSVNTKTNSNKLPPPAKTSPPKTAPVRPVAPPPPPPAAPPPRIQAIGNQTVTAGKTLEFQIHVETLGQPARPLHFALQAAPAGAVIDDAGHFKFMAPQSSREQTWNVEVQVAAAENPSQKSTAQFQLRLVPAPGSSQPPRETPIARRPWTKEPVPPAADVEAQVKLLLLQYAPEYAKANPQERLALAARLRTEALQIGDSVRRYALLTLLRQVALAQRDFNGVWQAIQFIEMKFDVDGTPWRMEAIEKLMNPAESPQVAHNVAQKYYEILARAQWTGSAVEALKALEPAEKAASLAKDDNLRQTIVTAGENLRVLASLEEEAEKAHRVLKQEPSNPEANFVWGRYLYLARNDHAQALPLLAQGSHELYRDAAKAELASPADAAARKRVGDLWWAIQKGEGPALRQRAMRQVMSWYAQARAGLDPAGLAEINGRNPEILAVLSAPIVPPAVAKVDPPKPDPAKPQPPLPDPGKPAADKPPLVDKPPAKPPNRPGPRQPESKPLEGSALTIFVRAVLERGGRIKLEGDQEWIRKPEELPGGKDLTVIGLTLEKNVADEVAVQKIRRIHSLQELTLDSNRLNSGDVHRLSELRQLTKIEINSARINDNAITAFAGMDELRSLTLRGTQLRGNNLDALADLTKLKRLELAGERILETTFIAAGKLTGLEELSLMGGNYSAKAIDHLQSLTHLSSLTLNARAVNDPVVSHVAELKSLRRLSLTGPIGGATLSELARLENLDSLTLVSSLLDEKDLGALTALKSLQRLTLQTRPLSNGVLGTLSVLTNLVSLSIQTPGGFNEAGLKHLDNLQQLRYVHLAGLDMSLESYLRYKKDHLNVDLSPKPDLNDKLKELGKRLQHGNGRKGGPRHP